MLKTQQNLLADFLFSEWIEKELTNKPELLDDYFQKKINKNIFGKKKELMQRVAILTDLSIEKTSPKKLKMLKKLGCSQKNITEN